MRQRATYWAPGGNDGFGSVVFEAPEYPVHCRWQGEAVLFRDAQAREQTSQAVVYPEKELELQGYLALGDYEYVVDPRTIEGAFEIRQKASSPQLTGDLILHKVFL